MWTSSASVGLAPDRPDERPRRARERRGATRGPAHRPATRAQDKGRRWPPIQIVAFLVAMAIPWQIYVGPLHLTMTRIVLLIAVLPALFTWLRGGAGRIRMPDVTVLLFIAWCSLATAVVHGVSYAFQSAGMLFIETAGAYFLARTYIRNQSDFYATCRMLFWTIACLLPFAIAEAVSGTPVLLNLFSRVMPSIDVMGSEPRWGLRRAQVVFEHPILFGVFCGSAFALTFLVLGYGRTVMQRWGRTAVVVAAAFCSLSSGPMTALAMQMALVGWNWLLRGFAARWKLLWGLLGSMYLSLSMVSHQSPAEHLINLVAFDKGSAYQRLLIWRYGVASIAAHPVFGVGFGDWARMNGQTSSVDMFWIISSLRHGILAGVMLGLTYFGACFMVGLKRGLSARQAQYRTAYLIAMTGFFIAGWTVDFWAEVYTAFLFLLGAGMWLLDAEPDAGDGEVAKMARRRRRRPTRTTASDRRQVELEEA